MAYRIPYNENRDDYNIKNIIQQRKIQNLVHFTKIKNLESILTNGFLSRQYLESNKIKSEFNDTERWDNKPTATCFSIEFPNTFLLNTFKEIYKDAKWVIILLDINLLNNSNKKCFCNKNAGGAPNWLNCDNSKKDWAFEKMFDEQIYNSNSPLRSQQEYIKSYLPTDIQAEILIEDIIDPLYIKCLLFETQEDLETCKNMFIYKDIFYKYNRKVDGRYFGKREDFPWEDR